MKQGITLVETIVYCSIFSIIMVGFASLSTLIFDGFDDKKVAMEALEEGNYIIEKIDAVLFGSQVVYDPPLGSAGTVLRLKNNESLYRFECARGLMLYKKDYGELVELTSKDRQVSRCRFDHDAGEPTSVRVFFELDGLPFSLIRATRL